MRKLNVKTTATSEKANKKAAQNVSPTGKNVAKPAIPDTKAAARSERAAVLDAHRATVSGFYAGASLAVHKRKAASFDTYAALAQKPVQACGPNGTSERDHSCLALIHANSKNGTFDPVALALDAGIVSRLASVKMLAYDAKAKTFSLTPTGTERAKLVTRKAS